MRSLHKVDKKTILIVNIINGPDNYISDFVLTRKLKPGVSVEQVPLQFTCITVKQFEKLFYVNIYISLEYFLHKC